MGVADAEEGGAGAWPRSFLACAILVVFFKKRCADLPALAIAPICPVAARIIPTLGRGMALVPTSLVVFNGVIDVVFDIFSDVFFDVVSAVVSDVVPTTCARAIGC